MPRARSAIMNYQGVGFVALLVWGIVAAANDDLLSIDKKIIHEAWVNAEESLELELSGAQNKYTKRSATTYGHGTARKVRQDTFEVWQRAEIFARAVDVLSERLNVSDRVSERLVENDIPRPGLDPNVLCSPRKFKCDANYRYRLIDGSCNNLRNPDVGIAVSRQMRLLSAVYGDGKGTFRKSILGGDLPLSRKVSTVLIKTTDRPDPKRTHLLMFFSQFVSHDITSSPHRTDLTKCCGEQRNSADCVPIPVPKSDPQAEQFQNGCIQFSRTYRACGRGVRQQINQVTDFFDLSMVYGNTEEETNDLRAFNDGLLKFTIGLSGELLPSDRKLLCNKPKDEDFFCFVAGDSRVNENPGLSAMHLLFLREHNRIATELGKLKKLDDETIYQEARRIVVAEYQNAIYEEYLPWIMNNSTMQKYRLYLPESGKFSVYDRKIDPSLAISFGTAANRFGHSIIQGLYKLQRKTYIDLADNFNNPTTLYKPGIEGLLMGAVTQPAQGIDTSLTTAVTRELNRGNNNPFGVDLAAVNIQRGRDHGLATYNSYRRFCRLREAHTEKDLRKIFADPDDARLFMDVYNNQTDDFDLWPAGLAEKPLGEGMMGETFSCLNADQFKRSMYGDRFFFTHKNQAGSFTSEQLEQLRKRSLANLICENTNVKKIQPCTLLKAGPGNAPTSCSTYQKLDLSLFVKDL